MRVLITGASGYIGHHLTRRLRSLRWFVTALTRPGSDLRGLDADRAETDGSAASIRTALDRAGPDIIFHLAADTTPGAGEIPPRMRAANIDLGLHLLGAAAEVGCRRFVDAGTFWEHDPGPANSAYTASKREFHARIAARPPEGVSVTTLVLFDIYGPRDWRKKLIPALLAAAREGRELPMTPGDQRLELVHVDDVVAGFLHAAAWAGSGIRTHVLDSGERHTLREIVSLLRDALPDGSRPIRVRWGAVPHRAGQIMEPVRTGAGGLIRLPGWSPHIPLREGLRQVAATDA
ncbi:MAG: NAD(P)-dependent oxidoreductase [Phycisphaerae bacterium]|nr:NAD(P)-dependent oxidoreductase [Phycisphaerae bacterium]